VQIVKLLDLMSSYLFIMRCYMKMECHNKKVIRFNEARFFFIMGCGIKMGHANSKVVGFVIPSLKNEVWYENGMCR